MVFFNDSDFDRAARNAASLDDGAKLLAQLLSGGYAVWTDGSLYFARQLVARVDGLRIHVYAREHAPPHFHVVGSGVNATFSIADCSPLDGNLSGVNTRLVQYWYRRFRPKVVAAWNASRPTDCPVGPISE